MNSQFFALNSPAGRCKKILSPAILNILLSSQFHAKEKDAVELICVLFFAAAGALIVYKGFQAVEASYPVLFQ